MLHFLQAQLSQILRKKDKTFEDAQLIYDTIRKLPFYDTFFAQNLKTVDFDGLLTLCQSFQYEKIPIGKFVFQRWDPSNEKFYVILSGKVCVLMPHEMERGKKNKHNKTASAQVSTSSDQVKINLLQATNENEGFKTTEEESKKEGDLKIETVMTEQTPTTTKVRRLLKTATFHARFDHRHFSTLRKRVAKKTEIFHNKDSSNSNNSKEDSLLSPDAPKLFTEEENNQVITEVEENLEDAKGSPNFYDDYEFEQYALQFGRLVRTLGEGEGFGEVALQNSSPRTATVLCKTDCEFLVITKQHFDMIFQKNAHEKEHFIKGVFPPLNSVLVSSTGLSYIYFSFKLETFTKGNQLTTEGRIPQKNPKLYLIYKGECLVEKTLSVQIINNHDKSHGPTKHTFSTQIAVVGKGMLAGEEILINKKEYNYSVKAVSETVQAYAITREDVEEKFFKEFSDYIIGLYERKKKQRDIICENAKKEFEAKIDQAKTENFLSAKNLPMKHLLSKPAIQGLTRYMQREQQIIDTKEPSHAAFPLSPLSPSSKINNVLVPLKIDEDHGDITDDDISPGQRVISPTQKRQIIESLSKFDLKDQDVESRMEFLSKLPDKAKKRKDAPLHENMDSVRLFSSRDPKRAARQKLLLDKALNRCTTANDKGFGNPRVHESIEFILKGKFSDLKKFKFLSPQQMHSLKSPKSDDQPFFATDIMRVTTPTSALSGDLWSSKTIEQRRKYGQSMFQTVSEATMKRSPSANLKKILSTKGSQRFGEDSHILVNKENPHANLSTSHDGSISLAHHAWHLDDPEARSLGIEKLYSERLASPPQNKMNIDVRENAWPSLVTSPLNRNVVNHEIPILDPPPIFKSRGHYIQVVHQRVHAQPKPTGTKRANAREIRRKLFQKPPKVTDQAHNSSSKRLVINTQVSMSAPKNFK